MTKKTAYFGLFSIFSKTVDTIRTKFSSVILQHIRAQYVQLHQNRMTGMRAIQKGKSPNSTTLPHVRFLFELFLGYCFLGEQNEN